jgi:hypothetical protein
MRADNRQMRYEFLPSLFVQPILHAQATVGRAYGAPKLARKAEALRRFPRYDT